MEGEDEDGRDGGDYRGAYVEEAGEEEDTGTGVPPQISNSMDASMSHIADVRPEAQTSSHWNKTDVENMF